MKAGQNIILLYLFPSGYGWISKVGNNSKCERFLCLN